MTIIPPNSANLLGLPAIPGLHWCRGDGNDDPMPDMGIFCMVYDEEAYDAYCASLPPIIEDEEDELKTTTY